MKENLRTTTSPSTGTYLISQASPTYTYTGKQARWYDNDSATYAPQNYGLLYNWNAAVDTFNTAPEFGETSVNVYENNAVLVTFNGHRRGICPEGWHLPSDEDWTQLINYVSSQNCYICDGDNNHIAKALASTTGWNSSIFTCTIGNEMSKNNATNFSAVPAGGRVGSSFFGADDLIHFWSSTQTLTSSSRSNLCYLIYDNLNLVESNSFKSSSFSVRCLRD